MAPPQHDAQKSGTLSKFRLFSPILAGATLKERLIGCLGALILRRLKAPLKSVIGQSSAISERRFITIAEPRSSLFVFS